MVASRPETDPLGVPQSMSDPRNPPGPRCLVAADAPGRAAGFAIDAVLLAIVSLVALTALSLAHGPVVEVRRTGDVIGTVRVDQGLLVLDTLAICALSALYFAGSWVRWGATIGQRGLGISLRPADSADGPPGLRWGPAIVRWLALGAPIWVAAGLADGNTRWGLWSAGVLWYAVLGVSVSAGSSLTGIHDRLAGAVAVRWAESIRTSLSPHSDDELEEVALR